MTRARLPDRRPCVTVDIPHAGRIVTVSVGYDPITGQFSEAFADAAKGTDQQLALADACVMASISLQHGLPLEVLEHSLNRTFDWRIVDGAMVRAEGPASAVGVALEAVRFVAENVTLPGFFDARAE